MSESVTLAPITPAERFAAVARQDALRHCWLRSGVSYAESAAWREMRAIDLCRYWESFPESYTAEQVAWGLVGVAAAAKGSLTAEQVDKVLRLGGVIA